MAIFGTFEELPFPDVIGMLGHRSGRLLVTGLPRHVDVTLHIDDTHLLAMHVGPHPVLDAQHVREIFLELTRAECGTFEFTRVQPNHLEQHHHLALNKLLLSITAVIDELAHYRSQLPAPDTRFQHLKEPAHTLDGALQDFFDRAYPDLVFGASAAELAHAQRIHVERAQLYLYKLRALGLIAPVRAFVAAHVANPPVRAASATVAAPATRTPEPDSNAPRGLIGRLLAALHLKRRAA